MLRSIASLPEAPDCESGVLFICRLPGPLYKTSKQILNLRGFRKSRTESVMETRRSKKKITASLIKLSSTILKHQLFSERKNRSR